MTPEPKKHISHWYAWAVIALLAGTAGFLIWTYWNDVDTIYNNMNTVMIGKSKTATTTTPATNTATADWKTYTNSTYGFSFKYPATWSVTKENLPTADKVEGTVDNNLIFTGPNNKILTVWVNPPGFGLEGDSDLYTATIIDGKISVTNKVKDSESKIGEAVIGTMDGPTKVHYTISYDFNLSDSVNALKEFDTILSTFQFTK